MMKDAAGKPIEKGEIVEVVDVVNFDDADAGDQKSGNKRQRKGRESEGK
jgi:hypothetical protein